MEQQKNTPNLLFGRLQSLNLDRLGARSARTRTHTQIDLISIDQSAVCSCFGPQYTQYLVV